MDFTTEELKIIVMALKLKYIIEDENVSVVFKNLLRRLDSELTSQIRYPEFARE